MTNSIRELRDADCIFITGSNTAESHPVISYEVVRAARKGASVIIIDPRRVPLVEHATLFLQVKPGTDIYVFLAIMHTMLREGWADLDFIAARVEGFEALQDSLAEYTPERAALVAGVTVAQIEQAARLYALGQRARGRSKYDDARGHSAILYAMGITQRTNGTDLVMTLANLAMLAGQVGRPSTGVNPLRGQSNVQGACDTGCLVNYLPGYRLVTDDARRAEMAQAWGVDALPGKVGLTVVEAMNAAAEGRVRALYVMGENPMMTDPDTTHVEHTLRGLDLLVVQDIFPSETAQLAHVLLPAAGALEKEGTFTNTERRVQKIRPVIAAPSADGVAAGHGALPDWQIIAGIAARFDDALNVSRPAGYWDYASPEAIFDEIARVTPQYGGMRYPRLEGQGLQWPCPDPTHPGTPYLHATKFTRGLGKFNVVQAAGPAEPADEEYPFVLTTGRVLYHYHSGTMTRRSKALDWREPHGYVEINPADAAALELHENDDVVIKSRRGEVCTHARISSRVPAGTIFLAFHWREASANVLTHGFGLDPVAKIPEFKVCAVRLERPNA